MLEGSSQRRSMGSDGMLLGKSCRTKYHIRNGTLKLGTLYEYRTIENEELRDQDEGCLTFKIKFHDHTWISTYWLNTLTGGSIVFGDGNSMKFPGRSWASINQIATRSTKPGEVELYSSQAVFSRESFNSFIFCMSKVRRTSECHGIFKDCDDYWFIKEVQARDFAMTVAEALGEHIHQKHQEGAFILPEKTNTERLEIHATFGEVQYLSREFDIHNNNTEKLQDFANKIKDMAFTKPDNYSKEKEYRFNFTAVVDGKIIEPITNSVILDSTPFMRHVFST